MEDYNALFNPSVEVKKETTGPVDEYRPSAAKGKNNIYQSIIRFVPWWKNPKYESIKEKWSCWLVDPITEQGRSVDCPTSIGKPSLLQDMYFKCKNSDNANLRNKMNVFSRRRTYASLIQVIKDENNPELEGKILNWKYGVKIHDKIEAELKPVIGEPHDPFDLIKGKAFALVITKVSGFNNYDQSKFVDKRIPFVIIDKEGNLKSINENTDKKMVFDYIKEHSANLDKYNYREWDQDTADYVNRVIIATTGESNVSSNFAGSLNSVKTEDGLGADVEAASTPGITSSDISMDEITESGDNSLGNIDLPNLEESGDSESGIGGDLSDILKDV